MNTKTPKGNGPDEPISKSAGSIFEAVNAMFIANAAEQFRFGLHGFARGYNLDSVA
jgi:hypothetical protein